MQYNHNVRYFQIRDLLHRVRTLYTCRSAELVGFATPRKEEVLVPQRFSMSLGAGGGCLIVLGRLLVFG